LAGLDRSDTFSVTLVLAEGRRSEIRRLADAVSEPTDSDYGRHVTREQLDELVRLPERELEGIRAWAAECGIGIGGHERQLVWLDVPGGRLEEAFGADIRGWLEKSADHRGARIEIGLPRRVAGSVLKVGGLPGERWQGDAWSGPVPGESMQTEALDKLLARTGTPYAPGTSRPPPALAGVAPADIAEVYAFPERWDGSGETIAVMMLGGQIDPEHVRAFWRSHDVDPPDVRVVDVGLHIPRRADSLLTLEAMTTVQWAGAMAPGARIVVYRLDPTVLGDPWAAFLLRVVGDSDNAPTVATTSWVTPERNYYRLHGHALITGLLDQAAALGITVIAASGDWGAFDGTPRAERDGFHVCDAPWPHAIFPAVEERVLGVGGTALTSRVPHTEIGWSGPPAPAARRLLHFDLLGSSGGFSEEVPIPPWQRPELKRYYPRGWTSPAVVPYGRGFPDVALMAAGPPVQREPGGELSALGYQALVAGYWIDWACGTSIAAPIWAAIIARLNQARRERGLPRLGFVNPLLYREYRSEPAVLRPITEGCNDVALKVVDVHGRAVTHRLAGFQCVPGWNPVCGLGVPDVISLIERVTSA
jgi:kumamolisin